VTQSIVAKDAHDLRYIFVNRAAEKLFGMLPSGEYWKIGAWSFPKTADPIEQQDRLLLAGNEDFEVAVRTVSTPHIGQRTVAARWLRIAGDNNESQIILSIIEDRTDETHAA
jgi:PAS domain-containing protein